jgi:hypothetical protein
VARPVVLCSWALGRLLETALVASYLLGWNTVSA